ncbi:FAR-17a/AIG1-like protein [Epithele typhae]|uniref:FAR-17a/AIG1-like protein n=1 Tax=Epithele typhae TaxID=378194 RepID=UPI002007D096|nr:FAR-17a/AIG1-like protein [Epithele typhae]KAH9945955.1 FAR-17a/AIG1-like protein [Epithele typhae]
MTTRPLPFFLHTTALAAMGYGYSSLPHTIAGVPIDEMKGGHFQFLTIQGLAIAWLTMLTSMACDLIPSSTLLRNAKRAFLMGALPLAIVISVIYWTLLIFLPTLILLEDPEPSSVAGEPESQRLPLHVDLCLHAIPAISLIVDFYLLEKKYSKSISRYGALSLASVLGTWYACWVEHCAAYNGFFPYPFLTYNPPNVRAMIYAGATAFAAGAFMLLNALHP